MKIIIVKRKGYITLPRALRNQTKFSAKAAKGVAGKTGWASTEIERSVLDLQIQVLNLSVRAFVHLWRGNVKTIRDLVGKTEDELLEINGIGKKTVLEIKQKLDRCGLSLKKKAESRPIISQ